MVAKALLQVTEEEKQIFPEAAPMVRSTSNPDANGDLRAEFLAANRGDQKDQQGC